MDSLTQSRTRTHRWPFLRCCPFAEHAALLGDLERDGLKDADVAALLPRARRLLTGKTDKPDGAPWWTR